MGAETGLSRVLALLYDVHGNLPALEAVLADAARRGAETYLLGGDYALFGAWPRQTVDRLRELSGATWLRGNGERWTADPSQAPDTEPVPGAIAACRAELGGETVRELASLSEQVVLGGVRFCHGSPISDVRSFLAQPAEDEDELLAGVTERRLVFGHTHRPFRREAARGTPRRDAAGRVELVNPGSVGMPFDGDPRSAYALLAPSGELEHVRVGYDHRASAAALRERFGGAWVDIVARRIEQARLS